MSFLEGGVANIDISFDTLGLDCFWRVTCRNRDLVPLSPSPPREKSGRAKSWVQGFHTLFPRGLFTVTFISYKATMAKEKANLPLHFQTRTNVQRRGPFYPGPAEARATVLSVGRLFALHVARCTVFLYMYTSHCALRCINCSTPNVNYNFSISQARASYMLPCI